MHLSRKFLSLLLVPPFMFFFESENMQKKASDAVAVLFHQERMKFVGVGVMFIENEKIALLYRNNTELNRDRYGLIGGLLDKHESALTGACRIVQEEVGIKVTAEQLQLVHVLSSIENNTEVIGCYFKVLSFTGTLQNNKPEKHDHIAWFPLDKLPPNLIERNRQAITLGLAGVPYSEYGWK